MFPDIERTQNDRFLTIVTHLHEPPGSNTDGWELKQTYDSEIQERVDENSLREVPRRVTIWIFEKAADRELLLEEDGE